LPSRTLRIRQAATMATITMMSSRNFMTRA
jgi:hypothetical protein